MSDFEEVLKPDRIGLATPEGDEVRKWTAPAHHKVIFKRRVFEIEGWCRKQGVLTKDEVVAYVEARWQVNRKQALEYVSQVVEDFSRSGHVYGQEANAKRL